MARYDEADVADVRKALEVRLRDTLKIAEPAAAIADVMNTMRHAEEAAKKIKAESMAFMKLGTALNAWLEAHVQAEVVRDLATHELRDEAKTNERLVNAVCDVLQEEHDRREKLDRAAALETAATLQTRGSEPTVQWFAAIADRRGFDATALVLLEALAVAEDLRLRPEGHTYWADREQSEKEWAVLIRLVRSPDARRR